MANYKIEDIEGIGEIIGKKLRDAGVKDTDSPLARQPGGDACRGQCRERADPPRAARGRRHQVGPMQRP